MARRIALLIIDRRSSRLQPPVAAPRRRRGSIPSIPQRTPALALTAPTAVMIGAVSVPAAVDQPQFVVQVAPNRVEVDEFNRWAAPLNDSIARAVAGDLAVQLGTPERGHGTARELQSGLCSHHRSPALRVDSR